MLIFLLIIFMPTFCHASKWQQIFIQPIELFADNKYMVHNMEINCFNNMPKNLNKNVVAIDTRFNEYNKFVEKAKDKNGSSVVDNTQKRWQNISALIGGMKFVEGCSQHFDWTIQLEEGKQCYLVHAIFPTQFATKEEITGIFAWMVKILKNEMNSDKWIGTYFPNSSFLINLRTIMYFVFIVKSEVHIYPEGYVEHDRIDLLPEGKLNEKNVYEYYAKMVEWTRSEKPINFDDYFYFLGNHILTNKIKIHGRMSYSENLLRFFEAGRFKELIICRAVGNWPVDFFDTLIQKIENGTLDPPLFGRLYLHFDLDLKVRWPAMGKFQLKQTKSMGSLLKLIYEFKSKKMNIHWTMELETTIEERFKTFANLEIFTNKYNEGKLPHGC